MHAFRSKPGPRRRVLLGALLLLVFGILPFHAAAHQHEDGHAEETCQTCLHSSLSFDAPVANNAALASEIPVSQRPREARRALQALHLTRESRGPPSA